MGSEEPRFYVYRPDGKETGPFSHREIQRFDSETLVRVENGKELWPRRRWEADGTLTVSQNDVGIFYLIAMLIAPVFAFFVFPSLWRFECAVGWLILIAACLIHLLIYKPDYPRFAEELESAQDDFTPKKKP